MDRYNIIQEKNKREIILLRGSGCVYKKCTFCDYYSDSSQNKQENYLLNKSVLEKVKGLYGRIEIINSGSVFELDNETINLIQQTCRSKNISTIHFESHYLYKDNALRENILKKGINETDPAVICAQFDEANFLFGIKGQSLESMQKDIELGLKYFERICINIMCSNTTGIIPDRRVIKIFTDKLYPLYKRNDRVDILINNTDFGVGN